VRKSLMHCNCLVYFSVIAWNTLEDLQNYSNYYSRLYVISSYKHRSVSQTILHQQIRKSKSSADPVRVKKPESGSCRTEPESGSKKSKIQCMHTSSVHCINIASDYAKNLFLVLHVSNLTNITTLTSV